MADTELRELLLTLERRGWDALCHGTGDAHYGQLMTEDALMVLANGAVLDRTAVAASLAQAPPWRAYDLSDVQLVEAGPDSVVLVYVGRGFREADQPPFVGLMSSVYVRREGQWRLALYQQTVCPAGDA